MAEGIKLTNVLEKMIVFYYPFCRCEILVCSTTKWIPNYEDFKVYDKYF
jgi:hypothetical protein